MSTAKCWACKDARATCNRARPRCSRCARSNRTCQYGLRLSWPKASNAKRSLTHALQDGPRTAYRVSQTSFVNTTSWDIQLHHDLWMHQGIGRREGFAIHSLHLPAAPSWLPFPLDGGERELLDHFICHTASSTLAILEPDRDAFLGLLVRLALSDSSPSSMAVLQSALALSSFHRHGLQRYVLTLKARALRTMIASCTSSMESATVVQHIAASMLLCHLEMLGMPNTLSLWFCHLSEAKRLIDNAGVDSPYFHGEYSRLLGWVEYHTVMSRFSIRHWYLNEEPTKGIHNFTPSDEGCLLRKARGVSYCSHEIVRCLHGMFTLMRRPTDVLYHDDEYQAFLRCLENKIHAAPPAKGSFNAMPGRVSDWVATIELFKLAALIYLQRASRNFSGTSPQMDAMVEKAYVLLDGLATYYPAFPLLIIGCEARTDEKRSKILRYIGKAREASSMRTLQELQRILEQIWVQNDLAVEDELDYLHRLDAVVTSYRIMPSFV